MKKLAAIYEFKEQEFSARILFEGVHTPITFYLVSDTILALYEKLFSSYLNIEVITKRQFEMELDHIRVFKTRSNNDLFVDFNDRMSDMDIVEYLNQGNEELDEINKKIKKINAKEIDPWLKY